MRRTATLPGGVVLGSMALLGVTTVLAPAAEAARSPVVITKIYYNSPGPDTGSNASLNHEWVKLHNRSNRTVTLTHWTLRDRAGHVFRFATYRLQAHDSVKIHTGSGSPTQTDRYWNHHWYIWNNTGDRATLKNARGVVKSRCSYSDPGENFAYTTC